MTEVRTSFETLSRGKIKKRTTLVRDDNDSMNKEINSAKTKCHIITQTKLL